MEKPPNGATSSPNQHKGVARMNLVVTITYNAMKDGILPPFFDCISAQQDRDFVLLVIDNASTDGTADYLRSLDMPNLRLMLNDSNIGFGRACNQGIELARELGARHITFLNNDTEFDATLLGDMVASLDNSGAAALSPLITYYDDPERIWFVTGSYRWNRGMIPYHDFINHSRSEVVRHKIYETSFAPGCCLVFDMAIFDNIPGFDPRYFVYWEDSDLCMMLNKTGYRIVTDTSLLCLHKVSISTGGAFSNFSIQHFNRGHMIFMRKHFGAMSLIYVLPVVIAKTLANLVLGRMAWPQFRFWRRGILEGLRN